jgi:hypothetical protein
LPRIRTNQAARFHTFSQGRYKACGRCIVYTTKTNSSNAIAVFLSSYDNQSLAHCPTAPLSKFYTTQVDLIDFHSTRQAVASRSNHRSSQFMQPGPCGFIAAQSHHPLKSQGADTLLLTGYIPYRPKPQCQGLPRILKDRARSHRDLETATSAQEQPSGRSPSTAKTTPRTTEAFGPSKSEKVFTTRVVRVKTLFKLNNRPRVLSHSHILQVVCGGVNRIAPFWNLGTPVKKCGGCRSKSAALVA